MKNHAQKFGFTLIELILVLTIISLLVSVIFANLTGTRAKARDAKRESDIKQIQNALNLYLTNQPNYPVCASKVVLGSPASGDSCVADALASSGSMQIMPSDPLWGGVLNPSGCGTAADSYGYCYISDGSVYTIDYALETDSILGKSAGWQSVSQ